MAEGCPLCKSTGNGYYHKSMNRLTLFISWAGEDYDCDTDYISGGLRDYCSDCHKDVTKYTRAN